MNNKIRKTGFKIHHLEKKNRVRSQVLKYGKGLVLRREGTGDNIKLTISFPGFGQKKLIEKFANLEKA